MTTCPVCEGPATVKESPILDDFDQVICLNCGQYEISRSKRAEFVSGCVPEDDRRRVLEAAKRETPLGQIPRISGHLQ